jgi:hypothetical protein
MARQTTSAPFNMARKRANEIAALVRHRHGRLPDTDNRCIYLEAAAHHLKPGDGDLAFALEQWARRLGAVLPSEEINAIVQHVQASPRRFRADTLALLLRVTYRERTALKLTTIGCIDVTRAQRTRLRKERKRRAQHARRRARGAMSRAEYLANSISRQQHWQAAGVSRATWYRHRCADSGRETSPCAADSVTKHCTNLSHEA